VVSILGSIVGKAEYITVHIPDSDFIVASGRLKTIYLREPVKNGLIKFFDALLSYIKGL
jgi:hypothetical protein